MCSEHTDVLHHRLWLFIWPAYLNPSSCASKLRFLSYRERQKCFSIFSECWNYLRCFARTNDKTEIIFCKNGRRLLTTRWRRQWSIFYDICQPANISIIICYLKINHPWGIFHKLFAFTKRPRPPSPSKPLCCINLSYSNFFLFSPKFYTKCSVEHRFSFYEFLIGSAT